MPSDNTLSSDDVRKLVGILGLLSSDFDGERAAAALAATRLLRARKLTWEDVIGGFRWELPPEEARDCWKAQHGVGGDLRFCVQYADRLSTWEQGFLRSVAIRPKRSPKQAAVIRQIAAGLRARGLA